MKYTNSIWVIILLLTTGCGGNKQSTDDIITVDVTASYPKKKLILQNFMDVEYIALETTDEFLTEGVLRAIGKDFILARNVRYRDGNLFVFDRSGKGLKRFTTDRLKNQG
jgi:hypothetical protein